MNPRLPAARTLRVGLVMVSALLCAAVLSCPTAAIAQAQASAFESASRQLQQARPGDDAAIEAAVQSFDKLLASQPDDAVLRAYLGAATSMRATTTVLPWKKIQHAEDGLAQIDKALAMLGADAVAYRGVPAALEVRLVAANTFLRLPAMFNRQERGRKLLAELLDDPLLDKTPQGFRATVWLRAADLAADDRQSERARQWYERVAATDTELAAKARSRLKEL